MNSMELFYEGKPLPLEEFGGMFSSCRSAFRLELLPLYTVDDEQEYIQLFEKDKTKCPKEFNQGWQNILDSAKGRLAEFVRVRKIPAAGLSSYMQFEFTWGYSNNVLHGEKIYTIQEEVLFQCVHNLPVLIDFWLFDDNKCCLMQYDLLGRFMGVIAAPQQATHYFVNAKKSLLQQSSLWSPK